MEVFLLITLPNFWPLDKSSSSNFYCKVITTLKTTTYPVTELYFPAITICGSGKHMHLVEKVCFLFGNFPTFKFVNIETLQPFPGLERNSQEYRCWLRADLRVHEGEVPDQRQEDHHPGHSQHYHLPGGGADKLRDAEHGGLRHDEKSEKKERIRGWDSGRQ